MSPMELNEEQVRRFELMRQMIAQGMPPAELADIVFDHIRREQLYILPHDDFNAAVSDRTQNILGGTNPAPRTFG